MAVHRVFRVPFSRAQKPRSNSDNLFDHSPFRCAVFFCWWVFSFESPTLVFVTAKTPFRIRRPLAAVRGSAPRKLLQKIVVERWGKAPARIRCFVRLVCCFAWLEHESCLSVSKALLHGTSSCCGPVGTALPKAPARIRCFVQLVCGFAWFSLNGFQ